MKTLQRICPVCNKDYAVSAYVASVRPLAYCSMACRKIATKEKNKKLTVEELRRRLDYDRESGLFTYKKNYGVVPGDASGWRDDLGYVHVRVGRLYLAHRLAWFYVYGVWPKSLDHINGDPLDNRISNLREATQSQNMWNMKTPSRNTSGRKGVSWDKTRSLWRVTIQAEGRWRQIGRFITLTEALEARKKAETRYHGSFARAT